MNGTAKSETEKRSWCHICTKNGRKSKLQYFQINFEEAILLCPDKECTYPLDSEPLEKLLIRRKPEDLVNSLRRKRRRIDPNQPTNSFGETSSNISLPEFNMVAGNLLLPTLPAPNHRVSPASMHVSCNGVASAISPGLDPGSLLYAMTSPGFKESEFSRLLTNGCDDLLPIDNDPFGADLANHSTQFLGNDFQEYTSSNSLSNNRPWSGYTNGSDDYLFSTIDALMPSGCGTVLCDEVGQNLKTEKRWTLNLGSSSVMLFDDGEVSSVVSDALLPAVGTNAPNCNEALNCCNNSLKQDALDSFTPFAHQNSLESWDLNRRNSNEGAEQKISDEEILDAVSIELVALMTENTLNADPAKHSDTVDINAEVDLSRELQSPVNFTKQEFDSKSKKKDFKKERSIDNEEKSSKELDNSSINSDSSSAKEDPKSIASKEIALKFLQWTNRDSLCWLDVVLSLLTHSKTLKVLLNESVVDSCLKRLAASYSVSQRLFRQGLELRRCELLCRMGKTVRLETSIGDVMVKTGGGNSTDVLFGVKSIATIAMDELEGLDVDQSFDVQNIFSQEEPNTISIEKMSQEASRLDNLSKRTLSDARDVAFALLERSLHCKKGQNDSPLIALTSLLAEDPVGKDLTLEYRWYLTCASCKAAHEDSVRREVVTFLKLPDDFKMSEPRFLRNCFSCKEPNQQLHVNFERLPDVFFHHFLEGVDPCRPTDLDFEFRGEKYAVTGLVQYKTGPDHFVSWLREPIADCWMECDDLKNCVCKYSDVPLTIPSSQIHIVMWEKQLENSGYCLPSERELVKGNDEHTELELVSNVRLNGVSSGMKQLPAVPPAFPVPATTSPPAVAGEKFCERSSPAPSSIQDVGSSRIRRSLETCSRLERMRQKFELDRRRSSSDNCGKPAIPRIPTVAQSNGEHSNKASTPTIVQQNSRNPNTRLTNTELLNGQNIPPVLQDACRNSSRKPRGEGDSRRKRSHPEQIFSSTRTKSLLKVGQHSYLDAILPLIKGQPTSSVQKFEGYIPKSQKLMTINVSEGCETARKMSFRKPKVCFSDTNTNDGNVWTDVSDSLENLHLRGLPPARNGILSKPNSKSSLRSKLPAQDVNLSKNHCDVSLNFNDEDLNLVVNGFDLDHFLDNSELELKLLADSSVRISSNAGSFDAMSASAVASSSFEINSHSVTATCENGTIGCSSQPMHCLTRIDQPQTYASVVNGLSGGKPSNELSEILATVGNVSGDSAHLADAIAPVYTCAEAGLAAGSDPIFPDIFEFSNGFDCDWPVFGHLANML